jgi:biotin carboxylase
MKMTNSLSGKRLMILGGNPETRLLVETARSHGVITWVVDPDANASAKQSANHALEIDGMDVPSIIAAARQAQVDGVLVGVADSLVRSYQQVCETLQIPCYASRPIIEAFSSKDGFAQTCQRYNVLTTPSYTLEQANSKDANIEFPVIVKPVDRGSGIGMSICHNFQELAQGIEIARSVSIKKRVLIEKFMRCDDLFAYYTFVDGQVYLSALADRITTQKQLNGSPVCIGAIYPGKYLQDFERSVHPRLVKMFQGLGLQNGVLNIQFFHEAGRFYAYDPGFRLQGEAPHLHLLAANGFDHRAMLIAFALSGKMTQQDFGTLNDVQLHQQTAYTVWILLKQGTISRIGGLDHIRTLASHTTTVQRFFEGDNVTEAMLGTERQVFARIYLQHHDASQLHRDIQTIHDTLVVDNETNQSLILDGLLRREHD